MAASAAKTDSANKGTSCWSRGDAGSGHLRVSEPLRAIPWESFWTHGIFGVTFAVGIPFFLQVACEFHEQHEELSKGSLKVANVTAVSYFPPKGLMAGCVVALIACSCRLYFKPYVRDLVIKEFSYIFTALSNIFTSSKDTSSKDTSSKDTSSSCCSCSFKKVFIVGGYLIVFFLLPMIAWLDRSVWGALLVDVFNSCRVECHKAHDWVSHHGGSHTEAWKLNNHLREFCVKAKMNKLPDYQLTWNQTGILPRITTLLGGYAQPDLEESRKKCFRILEVKQTGYIHTLLKKNNMYTAFDSRFRAAFDIGVFEIYGAASAVVFYIMMVGSRLALRTKLRALNSAKKELMLTHFMESVQDAQRYQNLFGRLHYIQYGQTEAGPVEKFKEDTLEKFWVTKVLSNRTKKADGPPRSQTLGGKEEFRTQEWKEEVFNVGDDDDEDGRLDSTEGYFTWENFTTFLLAAVFAGGHVVIPGIFRMSAVLGGSVQPFFGPREVAPAVIMNAVISFIFNALWFGKFVQTFNGQAEKLQQAVAFDCLWRFPDENPVKTIMREDRPLLEEVRRLGNEEEDPDFEKGQHTFFNSDGYRAAWGTMHSDDLWAEMYKLREWYHMRHYLQIDKFDERISMELAIVVALLWLVPQVLLIIYNFLMLNTNEGKLQAINFVTLWDFGFILIFVFKALMITLTFNDVYDRHRDHLLRLVEYIKLAMTRDGLAADTSADSIPEGKEATRKYKGQEAVVLVQTFQDASARFDAPSEFFGMKVDRKVITGFSSAASLLLAPQILSIVQDMCKGV